MRTLAIAAGVTAVIGLALLLGVALFANRIVASHHDDILAAVQKSVGRPVSIAAMQVRFWGGPGVRLDQLRIADDPRFSREPFVEAAAVTVRVSLGQALRGIVGVTSIALKQPVLHLIRDAGGHWNYTTLTHPCSGPDCTANGPAHIMRVSAATDEAAPLVARVAIDRVDVDDGTVILDDRSKQPTQSVRTEHIDVTLRHIGSNQPITVRLDMAIQRTAHNVHLDGSIGPIGGTPTIPIRVDGDIGPLGPGDVRISNLHLVATAADAFLRMSELNGDTLGGSFALTGQYPLAGDADAALKGQLTHINLAQLLAVNGQDVAKQMDGAANVALDLHGPSSAPNLVSGQTVVDVHDGVIKDFNVADEVLSRISGLPGVATLVSSNIRPKYKRLFDEHQTRFDTLHATLEIGEQRLRSNDIAIIASDFGIKAEGWMGFDRTADLAGTLQMSKRFSDDLVSDIKEAKYLLNDNGQLAVPFRLRGKLGEAKPTPDSQYLITLVTRAVGRGAAQQLLDGLLGRKGGQQPDNGAQPNSLEKSLRNLFGH